MTDQKTQRYIESETFFQSVKRSRAFRGDSILLIGELIEDAPSISPDEVRGVGEWITTRTWEHDGDPYCSLCGFENCYTTNSRDFKYCPNCGTRLRMKGAEDVR